MAAASYGIGSISGSINGVAASAAAVCIVAYAARIKRGIGNSSMAWRGSISEIAATAKTALRIKQQHSARMRGIMARSSTA